MKNEKRWWTITTDCGVRRTLAVSRSKAIRNVRYRIVMDDRDYDRPRPQDFAEMRDIEVLEARPDGDAGHEDGVIARETPEKGGAGRWYKKANF